MNDIDRTYFIYAQGSQLGPLEEGELVDHIRNRLIGRDAYLWREGYDSWNSILNCHEFQNLKDFLTHRSDLNELLSRRVAWQSESHPDWEFVETPHPEISLPDQATVPPESLNVQTPATSRKNHRIILSLGAAAIFTALTAGIFWWQAQDERWLQIEASEPKLLQMKRLAGLRSDSLKFFEWNFIKDSQSRDPRVLIAASLPRLARVKMDLVAQPATLVGALEAKESYQLIFERGIAVSPSLRKPNGDFLPEGDYQLRLTCLDCKQTGDFEVSQHPELLRIRAGTSADYQKRLSDYHRALKDQAQSELIEIGEILQLIREYSQYSKGSRKPATLTQSFEQLGGLVHQWDLDTMSSAYIFAEKYLEIQAVYKEVLSDSKAGRSLSESLNQRLMKIENFKRNTEFQLQTKQGYPGVR